VSATTVLVPLLALLTGAPPAAKAPPQPEPSAEEREEAEKIQQVLKSGPLPSPVTLGKEEKVEPTLGAEIWIGSRLEGCEATRTVDGAWRYVCRGEVRAWLKDLVGDREVTPAEARKLLKATAAELVKDFGGTASELETRSIGGEEVDVVQVDHPGRSVLHASAHRPKGLRTMYCRRRDPDRCVEVLELLLALPFPQPDAGGKVPGTRAAVPAKRPSGR
jgi:hypothetical protein